MTFDVRMALACVNGRGVEKPAKNKVLTLVFKRRGQGGVLLRGDSDLDGDGRTENPLRGRR
ncbi:MAG: hypothetical protein ACRDPR_13300 [Nocardioidaceae bacterium]